MGAVGATLGEREGLDVVGSVVGSFEGRPVGSRDGRGVGSWVGRSVGVLVGS